MNRYLMVGLAALLIFTVSGFAIADVITIDGDDSDWIDPDSSHDDTNGDVYAPGPPITYLPEYDIDWTYFEWDESDGTTNFMCTTIDPISNAYGADYVEIIINADDDETTGSPNYHDAVGADYYLTWDLDGTAGTAYQFGSSNSPLWYYWVGDQVTGSWSIDMTLSASDLVVAWGNIGTDYSVIEVSINPDLFGSPDSFTWGMYLDNGTTASDDASPDRYNQRGYTPEPTTMALLPIGLAALAAWRRRRQD